MHLGQLQPAHTWPGVLASPGLLLKSGQLWAVRGVDFELERPEQPWAKHGDEETAGKMGSSWVQEGKKMVLSLSATSVPRESSALLHRLL